MSWKYPVGFKYIDPLGDLECKILRRRIADDDRSFYIVEKTHPNLKFFEEIVMEDILDDQVRRGLPFVDETSPPEEVDYDLDFEPLTPKKRGPKRKSKIVEFVQPIYPRSPAPHLPNKRGRKPKATVPPTDNKLQLNDDQRRRLSEWKANRK